MPVQPLFQCCLSLTLACLQIADLCWLLETVLDNLSQHVAINLKHILPIEASSTNPFEINKQQDQISVS